MTWLRKKKVWIPLAVFAALVVIGALVPAEEEEQADTPAEEDGTTAGTEATEQTEPEPEAEEPQTEEEPEPDGNEQSGQDPEGALRYSDEPVPGFTVSHRDVYRSARQLCNTSTPREVARAYNARSNDPVDAAEAYGQRAYQAPLQDTATAGCLDAFLP